MLHYWSLDHLDFHKTWLTIGSFDGVHVGHQAIIERIVRGAQIAGLPSAAITFYPHPGSILGKREGAFYLSSPEEKADQLASLGLDFLITSPFNRRIANLSARDYVIWLKQHIGFRHLCVGQDFALGHNREGTLPKLQDLGKELDFEVEVISPIKLDGRIVSSSWVRQALAEGDTSTIFRLLGRPYEVQGEVVRGDNRGRSLGFPTANLDVWSLKALPRPGVYSGWASWNGRQIPAVTNVGYRPTFENQPPNPRVEAHLLDFDGNLYHQRIAVSFVSFLRDEVRFSSAEALIEQMRRDIQIARGRLEVNNHETVSGLASIYP